MTAPTDVDASTGERRNGVSPSPRRWLDVLVLWVAAVGAQALILFLLAQFQLQLSQTLKMQQIVELVARGELASAKRYGAEPDYLYFPTGVLVQFALVGLAVVLLAWTGRRALAWALPFALAVLSISPAYVSQGPISVKPIGEGGDWFLWASLVQPPTPEPSGDTSTWPLILGVVVQTALLLMPLIAAPVRRAPVSLATAMRWTALPATVVAVISLTTLELPTTTQVYAVPLAAFLLTLLAGAIATGAGATWQRLAAAVAVPAFLAPLVMPTATTDLRQDVGLGLMATAASASVIFVLFAVPELHRRVQEWRTPGHDAVAPAAH